MLGIVIEEIELLSSVQIGDVFVLEDEGRIFRYVDMGNDLYGLLDDSNGKFIHRSLKDTKDAYNYIRMYYGNCRFANIKIKL
jgi:hypothetical protein